MQGPKSLIIKLLGFSIFAGIFYVFLAGSFTTIAFIANQNNKLINTWPINSYQRSSYFITFRNIWQYQKNCAKPDEKTVYSPVMGACEYNNVEFKTLINFDQKGRFVPARVENGNPGVVILGDSHAMGWGVNDEQTYANILQQKIDRPVYNLGVSSYATERELIRLKNSNLLDKIDTIILQYCDNDKNENSKDFDFAKEFESRRFAKENSERIEPTLRTSANHVAALLNVSTMIASLKVPLQPLKKLFPRPIDFKDHQKSLTRVLQKYSDLLEGKRVILFYSNAHGRPLSNFDGAKIEGLDHVELVDLKTPRELYYILDDHLNFKGHQFVGDKLAQIITGIDR